MQVLHIYVCMYTLSVISSYRVVEANASNVGRWCFATTEYLILSYTATSQRMHRCVLPHISHSQLIDYMPFYKQRSCYLGVFAFCIYAQCDVIVGSQSLFKTQCTSDRDISCSDGKGGSGFVRFLLEFSTRVVFIALLISEKD